MALNPPFKVCKTILFAICHILRELRKGRKYAEEFMANNVVLIRVEEDVSAELPSFLKFLEKFRGIPGSVCLGLRIGKCYVPKFSCEGILF